MNDNNLEKNSDERDFIQRAREALASEAENLNAPVRSKLTQARHAALEEMPLENEDGTDRIRGFIFGRKNWVPAGAALAIALVAIAWWGSIPQQVDPVLIQPLAREATISADDFEMLMSEDGIELLEDLDFYAWVESELPDEQDTAG